MIRALRDKSPAAKQGPRPVSRLFRPDVLFNQANVVPKLIALCIDNNTFPTVLEIRTTGRLICCPQISHLQNECRLVGVAKAEA